MKQILKEERFDFISDDDKEFMIAFNNELTKLGYHFGGTIGSGFCWGKYMVIYTKVGVKSKKVYARIYIRGDSIVLRLFFSKIDSHREFIENTPEYIKEVFVGGYGKCSHCKDDKNGVCKFRKTYTIHNQLIEKCNGKTFEFHNPNLEKLPDYINIFTEFYSRRKR